MTFAFPNVKNIILIGMPNSGKSYLGKQLSQEINKTYYDCDLLNPLFNKEKKTKKDWREYRDLEYKILQDVLSDDSDKIISTGGGCIENHKIFNLFLNTSKESKIIHIIRNNSEGIVKNLPQEWDNLWIKRGKWYFLISDLNYWNDGSFHDFLIWYNDIQS